MTGIRGNLAFITPVGGMLSRLFPIWGVIPLCAGQKADFVQAYNHLMRSRAAELVARQYRIMDGRVRVPQPIADALRQEERDLYRSAFDAGQDRRRKSTPTPPCADTVLRRRLWRRLRARRVRRSGAHRRLRRLGRRRRAFLRPAAAPPTPSLLRRLWRR